LSYTPSVNTHTTT